jgi:predicted ArsR family transcriptional regulator
VSDATLTTEQARALGAPTRRSILAHLADAGGPVPVATLTAQLGLNHNAVRKHLAQLVATGLVLEEREPRDTAGRPRLLYRLPPPAPVRAQPYERLAVLLATALRTGADPVSVGRDAAAIVADEVAGGAPESPVAALAAQLEADGFEPVVRRRGRKADIVLQHCPYAAAASANPDAVCRLHLGLAEGAAEAIGGVRVDGLTVKDPERAGCRVAVSELRDR